MLCLRYCVVLTGDSSRSFLRKVEPIASRVPYMTTPGNHELWFNFTAYKARFWMPTPVAGEPRPAAYDTSMYYSLNIGSLHLVMYNTETWYDTANMDKAELAWIKSDLEAAAGNRGDQPWIIAAGHRPLYVATVITSHAAAPAAAAFASAAAASAAARAPFLTLLLW